MTDTTNKENKKENKIPEDKNKNQDKKKSNFSFSGRKNQRRRKPQREDDGFDQKIVHIARVTRVMKGGKRMRFRACVAVGDKKGKVGVGIGKSADVTAAITKGTDQAKKNLINVQLVNDTIAHEVKYKYGAARIMMRPASQGRGIIAGGAMRLVLELAGINNIVGKIQGSNNKVNIVKCVIEALGSLKKIENKSKDTKDNKTIK